MSEKIEQSLIKQREQLTQLVAAVEQLKGSITALEYVQTLNLLDPITKSEEVPSDPTLTPQSKGRLVKFPKDPK